MYVGDYEAYPEVEQIVRPAVNVPVAEDTTPLPDAEEVKKVFLWLSVSHHLH